MSRIARAISRRAFSPLERFFGLHLTPAHFYSPIPIVSDLKEDVYSKIFDCPGVHWNLDQQLRNFALFQKYGDEFAPETNRGLSLLDAFMLYAMVREKQPKIMIEIGAGATTRITLEALKRNETPCEFISIEPYPSDAPELKGLSNYSLIARQVQDVGMQTFSDADLLFIDSSHVSKIGSDVNYEILDIVPRLKVGALVHWHDIVMPRNYWKDWIKGGWFWNESYMVHSFMLFNDAFKIEWASQYLQTTRFDDLKIVFPRLEPKHRLTSFWVKRVK